MFAPSGQPVTYQAANPSWPGNSGVSSFLDGCPSQASDPASFCQPAAASYVSNEPTFNSADAYRPVSFIEDTRRPVSPVTVYPRQLSNTSYTKNPDQDRRYPYSTATFRSSRNLDLNGHQYPPRYEDVGSQLGGQNSFRWMDSGRVTSNVPLQRTFSSPPVAVQNQNRPFNFYQSRTDRTQDGASGSTGDASLCPGPSYANLNPAARIPDHLKSEPARAALSHEDGISKQEDPQRRKSPETLRVSQQPSSSSTKSTASQDQSQGKKSAEERDSKPRDVYREVNNAQHNLFMQQMKLEETSQESSRSNRALNQERHASVSGKLSIPQLPDVNNHNIFMRQMEIEKASQSSKSSRAPNRESRSSVAEKSIVSPLSVVNNDELIESWRNDFEIQGNLLKDEKAIEMRQDRLEDRTKLGTPQAKQPLTKEEKTIRFSEQQKRLHGSFYSALIDTAKVVTSNILRITNLVSQFSSQLAVTNSDERMFFNDLLAHLDKTQHTLKTVIQRNVLNINEQVHASISTNINNLTECVRLFISISHKLVTNSDSLDRDLPLYRKPEFIIVMKRATAVHVQTKHLINQLEEIKLFGQGTTDGARVLSVLKSETEAPRVPRETPCTPVRTEEPSKVPSLPPRPVDRALPVPPAPDVGKVDLSRYNSEKIEYLQRVIRRHLVAQIELKKKEIAEDKLNHFLCVSKEIYDTEVSYMESIEIVYRYFYIPYRAQLELRNPVLTYDEINTIFSKLDPIYTLSKKLVSEFRTCLEQWPKKTFSEVFIKYADDMLVYSDYIINFDSVTELLSRLHQDPRYVELENKCIEVSQQLLNLLALLVMPVQRIPRYVLLLKQLISYADAVYFDYNALVEALERVNELCATINEQKRKFDNNKRLQAVYAQMGPSQQRVSQLLSDNASIYITEEFLQLERGEKIWTKCFLFNNMLVVARASKNGAPPPYIYIEHFMLKNVGVISKKKHRRSIYIWDKTGTNPDCDATLHFESERICALWLKEMLETIETLLLQDMLDEGIHIEIKGEMLKQSLVIISATYGDLGREEYCIDVTLALQNLVKQEGGRSLTLPATSKAKLAGFTDPCKGKKKSLLIVYTTGSMLHTKTFRDDVAISIVVPDEGDRT
ncbi:rac guanine nucleotide exchange factor JJ-like isoform X1 [Schistocerca gregaria]|nr:rac guanine nucleotide exchange factor JJ-like isoform X1 [Schistocerca gregaria]XP_049850433.1 rac guanine nucleotide exchange factor JJ-like isoform X1 [Schistocerca gregaria]